MLDGRMNELALAGLLAVEEEMLPSRYRVNRGSGAVKAFGFAGRVRRDEKSK